MKKAIYILLTLALSFTAIGTHAQPNNYLDKVVEQLQKSKGITADFTLQGDAHSGMSMKGTIKMQGKMFTIVTDDLTTWYDGKTMWSYAPCIDEVNITTPTHRELAEVNPYILLDNYNKSYAVKEIQSQQKSERQFKLTPTKRNTTIAQIVVTIATANKAPISFEITDNANRVVVVAITNYNDKAILPASTFKFDSKQYPQTTIVDLR
jgi:outer membrane lipoprotein-sorting protein